MCPGTEIENHGESLMIKACIIGISGYGGVHYNLLTGAQSEGQVDLVGATVINQDQEQAKCAYLRSIGCQLFDDYTVMLAKLSGVADLCCIPTGTPLHRVMTIAALEAGMHVFVEKPAAGCLQDVRDMQAAAEQAGKQVAVGYQQMYDPMTLELKRALLEGKIGAVEGMKCRVAWPRDSSYYGRNKWAGQLRVGDTWVRDSPANNAVAHDLMMMLFLAGPTAYEAAKPVAVQAELYRANPIPSADTVALRIETDTGIPLLFYATHACRENRNPLLVIRGSAGGASWSHAAAMLEPTVGAKRSLDKTKGDLLQKRMLQTILDVSQGGSPFYCDLGLASAQTQVIEAMHQTSEIHSVNCEWEYLDNGKTRAIIHGIEKSIERAFEQEQLFSEFGGIG